MDDAEWAMESQTECSSGDWIFMLTQFVSCNVEAKLK